MPLTLLFNQTIITLNTYTKRIISHCGVAKSISLVCGADTFNVKF